ncbi:cytochrome c [Ancylomarina euxinus]|uniref:Cytochrome c n=1 Tax=Ancylomarina euxinus TaxID=2283627 RepID=A0A425XZW5_9BACT|nr:cytochrome c [Ancylomarina euxinus]MCZ4695421.1 cytochrome c [Ancylomarina euxinus]MUP15617.1 c-type cytochrome [Ancylomarina euxinus]RRG20943.1 cytochrome c [Ancylomarina euxinus]
MNTRTLVIVLIGVATLFLMAFIKPFSTSESWEVPAKYKKMKNPYAGVEDSERVGQTLYVVHCKSCHGKTGMGDGTKSKSLKTAIPNFTSEEFQCQTDGELYYKTIFGRDEMPSYEKKIKDDEDRWLLVNYIRTLNK